MPSPLFAAVPHPEQDIRYELGTSYGSSTGGAARRGIWHDGPGTLDAPHLHWLLCAGAVLAVLAALAGNSSSRGASRPADDCAARSGNTTSKGNDGPLGAVASEARATAGGSWRQPLAARTV